MLWKVIALSSFVLLIVLCVLFTLNYFQMKNDETARKLVLAELLARVDSLENSVSQSKGTELLLKYNLARLSLRMDMLRQKGRYLVIDRHRSHFWVREGDAIIYEGTCGVGRGKRRFLGKLYDFETPAGKFSIVEKLKNPWWFRPDWFWREKGMKVPDKFIQYPPGVTFNEAVAFYNSLSDEDKLRVRAVPGFLGKYALKIADGIYIHYGSVRRGPVSHGCIRVSEKDVETLYKLLDEGAPVYVY